MIRRCIALPLVSVVLAIAAGCGGGATPSSGTVNLSPILGINATAIAFPNTQTNTTSAAKSVTLTNTGGAALAISSVAIGGTNASNFTLTNGCGTSLAAGGNCPISLTFTPNAITTFNATLTLTDNASGSTQSIALSGTGIADAITVTPVAFNIVAVAGKTSIAQTSTITSNGNAVTSFSIALNGTNASSFTQTNTCGTTLAASATCTVSVTFSPTTTGPYTAALSVNGNSNTLQTVPLNGTGIASTAITQSLVSEPEADGSSTTIASVNTLIAAATKTIDMTMYELQDATIEQNLINFAAVSGHTVRVILDASLEMSNNTAAYNTLHAHGVNVVWSNTSFQATHEKTMIIDAGLSTEQMLIMTFNLTPRYYSTSRDYGVLETNPNDIAAAETTFNADFASSYGSASPLGYVPPTGDDLVWSPFAKDPMLSIINGAQHTLQVENEELTSSASYITSALVAAAGRGVNVQLIMTCSSDYFTGMTTLKNGGGHVATYDANASLYIHAKVILADYGYASATSYAGQQALVGSENFSDASLTKNRELGLFITPTSSSGAQTILDSLNTKLNSDYAGAVPYQAGVCP